MQYIKTYFPNLTPKQENQFTALGQLYTDWNAKINVISRKDIENLYLHHILHSLGIAKTINFADGSEILDVGTGGGFPGIPLAILFPECKFHLIDRIGKKIKENKSEYDFVVSRAVMPLPDLLKLIRKNIKKEQRNALPNGLLCLKGGELQNELVTVKKTSIVFDLKDYFKEDYFDTKKVVYVQIVKK